ncbi:protein slowmo homolog [Schistocerca gregaria]|uniref:protein slowmo homolog n=1 Tax=Schistocerca gregaria TaxID=7010 RepID=UPI00211DEF0E|nr:protein slowmo homolog [Schistocerca gregaria]
MSNSVEITHVFKHHWRDVFLASWKKYPNPKCPEILSVDLVNKEIDPVTGCLTTTRVLVYESAVPIWVRPLFKQTPIIFVEEARVDPINKKMVLKARNVTFDKVVKTEETCIYTPNAENPNWTNLHQTAKFESAVSGVASIIENVLLSKFSYNASKGRQIMESAIQAVESEMPAFSNFE